MKERRSQERVAIERSFSESDPRTLTPISNLSRGGVFVHTDVLFAVGSKILLRFVAIPSDPVVFEHVGVVRRLQREPSGMGVEFTPLPDAKRDLVDRILADARARASRRGRRTTLGQRQVFDIRDFRAKLAAHE